MGGGELSQEGPLGHFRLKIRNYIHERSQTLKNFRIQKGPQVEIPSLSRKEGEGGTEETGWGGGGGGGGRRRRGGGRGREGGGERGGRGGGERGGRGGGRELLIKGTYPYQNYGREGRRGRGERKR